MSGLHPRVAWTLSAVRSALYRSIAARIASWRNGSGPATSTPSSACSGAISRHCAWSSTATLRAPDIAEELVQDLLLTFWDQRATIELRDSLRVYLFRAARNRLNSLRRTRREIAWARDAADEQRRPPPKTPDVHTTIESRELSAAINATISELPERRRLAFQLTQQAGLSHADAAAVMGIAPKTIAIHLGLARQELRGRLGSLFDE